MGRIAYVNGRYSPHGEAAVHVEDRGFQFADGVYEVWGVAGGRLMDAEGHFARLDRSLSELAITPPMSRRSLERVLAETLRRNRVCEGLVYLQITRGAAPRDHAFPHPAPPATVVVTVRAHAPRAKAEKIARGVSVISWPDQRWARCDIKTVSLLPNVLAKQAAKSQGAVEAWLLDGDGCVTEGAASNAWIVTAQGALVTRGLNSNILAGVTRARLLEIARNLQIRVEERAFTLAEAKAAREAFISSATNPATSVVRIDGALIGDGAPGPIATILRAHYGGIQRA